MRYSTPGLVLMLAALSLTLPAWAQDDAKGYPAITIPSKEAVMSFVRPGRVAEVLVKKGDAVKAGQLLARQDDREEVAALKIDQRSAEDMTSINAETAVRDQKAKDYERMTRSSVGILELQNAELEVKVADARILMAKAQHEKDQLKVEQTKISVEKLQLFAPNWDGIVAEEFLQPHESADGGNMKVIKIVQLDPIRMEVPVPILKARTLKVDDLATVTAEDGEKHAGKVVLIPKLGDAASDTLLVRVEMPNPDKKIEAGQTVHVTFGPQATPQVGAAKNP